MDENDNPDEPLASGSDDLNEVAAMFRLLAAEQAKAKEQGVDLLAKALTLDWPAVLQDLVKAALRLMLDTPDARLKEATTQDALREIVLTNRNLQRKRSAEDRETLAQLCKRLIAAVEKHSNEHIVLSIMVSEFDNVLGSTSALGEQADRNQMELRTLLDGLVRGLGLRPAVPDAHEQDPPARDVEFQSTSSGEVVRRLKDVIAEGYGVVPFLGSGMSAQSGIPSGVDYQAYLFYCLARVFGETGRFRDQDWETRDPWNPKSLRWPSFQEVPHYDNLQLAQEQWASHIRERGRAEPRSKVAMEEAADVARDWRRTLDLVARLDRPTSKSSPARTANNTVVVATNTDDSIIDSCFTNLVAGKHPNTAHLLLAHLADVLRIKVIVTTNFDNLIEQAFQLLDMPVVAFDVHRAAGFPNARLVRAQRSVVKIHGGFYGLRAGIVHHTDYAERDVRCFSDYLRRFRMNDSAEPEVQRHLLVVGASWREKTTVHLLSKALIRLRSGSGAQRGLQVYWVCHRRSDELEVYNAFDRTLTNLCGEEPEARACALRHLVITSTVDLGLFFLNLYQNVLLCLPPAGVPFNAVWPIPPQPFAVRNAKETWVDRLPPLFRAIRKEQEFCDKSGPVYLVGEGSSSAAAEAFFSLYGENHCLWFDLPGLFDPLDFSCLVVDAIARQLGRTEIIPGVFRDGLSLPTEPSTLPSQLERLGRTLSRLILYAKRPLVLFINGRDIPGNPNTKNAAKRRWEPSQMAACIRVVRWLNAAHHVRVVLIGWPGTLLDPARGEGSSDIALVRIDAPTRSASPDLAADLFASYPIDSAANADAAKQRFLKFALGLSLFRVPSYRSAVSSWALLKARGPKQGDYDQLRFDEADGYLATLRDRKIIRDDAGHGVFLHASIRRELREQIGKAYPLWVAEAHQGISDWYVKLFRTCGDIHAAFESMHHRLESFRWAGDYRPNKEAECIRLRESALNELELTLDMIRPMLFLSTRPLNSAHVFDELRGTASSLLDGQPEDNWRQGLAAWSDRLQRMQARYFFELRSAQTGSQDPVPGESLTRATALGGHEQELESLLQNARREMNARRYRSARGHLLAASTLLNVDPDWWAKDIDCTRDHARAWLRGGAQDPADPKRQGRLYGALLVLRRTQLLNLHVAELARESDPILEEAERLYVFSTELMRYMHSVELIHRENAILRTDTGLVLARLRRHAEARRRHSEAYAYLSHVSGNRDMQFATIDLRRGEVFLTELQNLKRSGELPVQLLRGLLSDCVASIHRAAYKARGATLRPRWFAWLYEVEMETCLEIARAIHQDPDLPMYFSRCRDRGTLGQWFKDVLENALDVVDKDPVRLGRYSRMTQEFLGLDAVALLPRTKIQLGELLNACSVEFQTAARTVGLESHGSQVYRFVEDAKRALGMTSTS